MTSPIATFNADATTEGSVSLTPGNHCSISNETLTYSFSA